MPHKLTTEEVNTVLTAALEHLRAQVDAEITSQRILTLLTVAKNPGVSQMKLPQHIADLSQSAVSRNLMDLSHLTSARQPGPSLILQSPDPEFRRRFVVSLTANGEKLLEGMASAVNRKLAKLK